MYEKLKSLVKAVKTEISVWRCVMKDPRTPKSAKWLLAIALGYLVLPFELIPDFIPVIGYLDDVIIVGLLVWIARRLIPQEVIQDCRSRTK